MLNRTAEGKNKLQKQQQVETLDNSAKLFDKSLLAELTTEDTWMERLRRVIERGDKQGFELMGPYTNPLWSQMAVQDDCILVNNRLAVPVQLRQAVLKRIHRGHPGQEAMLGAAQYLWWPHMNKDIVNLAEECRSCTRYGKNVKYLISKNTSKPLPLLTQPGQEVQLDYAGPIENQKGKKIYLLVAIDRFSKFPSVEVTKSTSGKCTVKFLRSYIDTHGVPESIRSDQFSGFKGKTLKKFCSELNIEQKFCPVGDHRGCGLVERTIQTIKRRLGVMMLEENNKSIKLCLSIIMRDLRWNKQKTIQVSPFQAHFGRLPKTKFKIVRDRFLNDSEYLDKQHLERSALTASQLKRRIDQSRENLKIVRKGQLSRDTSPLHKQQLTSDRDKEKAKALKDLLEANARWNNERRDAAKNDIRKLVDETGLLNPDLRKEMIYSWEKGFGEDNVENQCKSPPKTILRKDPLRKSGQALTRQLKGKIASETDSTIKTSTGSIYRKSDIGQSKTVLTQDNQRSTSKSPSVEPTKKFKRISSPELLEELGSDEELQEEMEIADTMNPIERFQKSQTIVTSKDTEAGGGLNLAVKRAKPNLAGPKSTIEENDTKKSEKNGKEKKNRNKQQQGKSQTATAVNPEQEQSTSRPEKVDTKNQSSSTPKPKQRSKLKYIDSHTPLEDIVDTFHNRNLAPSEWEKYADKLLKRGVQRVADEIRGNPQQISEKDTTFEPPQGFSDESSTEESRIRRSSRQTKNKEPKRFGDPIKHSIKEISENLTGGGLLKEALKEYRNQLRDFKDRSDRPMESKVRRLERHLFMRNFGYATLDEGVEWNPSWEIELEEN